MYTNGHISQVTAYSFSITFAFTFAFRLGEPWTPRRREDDSAVAKRYKYRQKGIAVCCASAALGQYSGMTPLPARRRRNKAVLLYGFTDLHNPLYRQTARQTDRQTEIYGEKKHAPLRETDRETPEV